MGGGLDLILPGALVAPAIREDDARLFRCHAPQARAVALVGDFNGWDPEANPLQPGADGWWQLEVRLPAGSYLYAYLVDGVAVVPEDAEVLVDDGFGGKNGLIRVEPGAP
jgi:1,4-alpha-glucan branching enzyme